MGAVVAGVSVVDIAGCNAGVNARARMLDRTSFPFLPSFSAMIADNSLVSSVHKHAACSWLFFCIVDCCRRSVCSSGPYSNRNLCYHVKFQFTILLFLVLRYLNYNIFISGFPFSVSTYFRFAVGRKPTEETELSDMQLNTRPQYPRCMPGPNSRRTSDTLPR